MPKKMKYVHNIQTVNKGIPKELGTVDKQICINLNFSSYKSRIVNNLPISHSNSHSYKYTDTHKTHKNFIILQNAICELNLGLLVLKITTSEIGCKFGLSWLSEL